MKHPIVFLLDLDGTIQGNIMPQLQEFDMINKLNSAIIMKKKIKYNISKLYSDMDNGLIRPFFKNAILEIKKKHNNIEFFVYTASQNEWAIFILDKIFKHLFDNTKVINKPYFTRNHCLNNGHKSIEGVKQLIKTSLKRKYPKSNIDSIYLVDNNLVLLPHEMNKLIHCNTYDYVRIVNPLRNLNNDVIEEHYKELSMYLLNKPSSSYIHFNNQLFTKLQNESTHSNMNNKIESKDMYWLMFSNIIKSNKLNDTNDVYNMIDELKKINIKKKSLTVFENFVLKI
jgi:hypothetical protein